MFEWQLEMIGKIDDHFLRRNSAQEEYEQWSISWPNSSHLPSNSDVSEVFCSEDFIWLKWENKIEKGELIWLLMRYFYDRLTKERKG